MNTYKFIISGKVQGVYYRKTIASNSNSLKFNGYVKNLSNGSVEAVVSCEETRLSEFIAILKKGSQYSKVTNIVQSLTNGKYTNGFKAIF